LANSDPEGAGWFYKVKLNSPVELDGLMDAAAYQALAG
jgi:glycine cleavage system H protein